MDSAAGNYSLAYNIKVHKDTKSRPSRTDKESRTDTKSSKSRKGSKGRECHNLTAIRQSLCSNCCDCCVVFAAYLKETGKLLTSCLNEHATETRLCEIFSQLVTAAASLGGDFLCLLCYLWRVLFVINDEKK